MTIIIYSIAKGTLKQEQQKKRNNYYDINNR